jgi:imidazolonepropionase
VLGLDRNRGRLAAGQRADVVLLDAPDWRHLAYHLAGNVVHTVVQDGRIAFLRA